MIKCLALPLLTASAVFATTRDARTLGLRSGYADVCQSISSAISNASAVYYPGSMAFTQDMNHWASSSSNTSACSVRPGTAADVGVVLQIVASTQTPFAVKGGGHATNPGFSSTPGVHISLANFNEVTYSAASSTAVVGAGLVWDDVYEALQPLNVNVVGGRVTGVGVAGFTLGGGYSWLSNQYGLTVDNVVNFELVLPNGTVTNVNAQSDSDLFFGLKGGFNNYGIVTRFTMNTYPQGQVWGGLINVGSLSYDAVINATAEFSTTNIDPKAAAIIAFNVFLSSPVASILLFYDGPNPPAGIFDNFLALPFLTQDVKTRSFLDLVKVSPSDTTAGTRQLFNTAPSTDYSVDYVKAVANESTYWGGVLALSGATFVSYDIEPFLPSALSFGGASGSAYPPNRNTLFLPTNILFSWGLATNDDIMKDAARQSRQALEDKAVALGQDLSDASVYGNYAIDGTSLEDIYGANLPRLRALKTRIDPNNVMGLAGGWKFA